MATTVSDLPRLPPRDPDAHKGDFGRILVVGGSIGMVGAPALAGLGSLRSGAGLVRIAVPTPIQQTVAGLAPCATTIPLATDESGRISEHASDVLLSAADGQDVIALGPGMGQGGGPRAVVSGLLELQIPTVIDADGLNNLADFPNWPQLCGPNVVLTPHPGEMRRLTAGLSLSVDLNDRQEWSCALSQACRSVIVLKGHRTVVSDPDRVYVNRTGNPGMATGGTGDVLTGVIAALIVQGLTAFEAAVLGAHVHGLAGDIAADRRGQVGMIASDLLDTLPDAFLSVDAGRSTP